jgi:hypothetical protein
MLCIKKQKLPIAEIPELSRLDMARFVLRIGNCVRRSEIGLYREPPFVFCGLFKNAATICATTKHSMMMNMMG